MRRPSNALSTPAGALSSARGHSLVSAPALARAAALSLAIAAVTAGGAAAQPARPGPPPGPDLTIDAATRTKVIDGALAALTKAYVFPEVAAKMQAEIRKHVAAKKYDSISSARAFAEALTTDLRAVSRDKHLRVMFNPEPIPDRKPGGAPPPAEQERFREQLKFWNAGYVKAERLDGNVGYLRVDGFAPAAEAAPRAAAAMTLLGDTGALIIDLRWNGGGDPESVALLVSYLFAADDERHINDIYNRPDNTTRQFWTMPSLAGTRYAGKPVYVLTSGRTFSGGEEFAYDVQALKRGTLVGEVTGGGANPGGPHKVHANFAVNVPDGRAINPVTKTNWEGVGVKPEVSVPAERALDTAYLAALEKVRAGIDPRKRPGMAREIDEAIAKLRPAKK